MIFLNFFNLCTTCLISISRSYEFLFFKRKTPVCICKLFSRHFYTNIGVLKSKFKLVIFDSYNFVFYGQ